MSMRSSQAYQILSGETRNLSETSGWSAPNISRLFALADATGREIEPRTFPGSSTEVDGKETFYTLKQGHPKQIGHTLRGKDNLRTFYDEQGHLTGHEVPGENGMTHFAPAPRHVQVHGEEHQPHARIKKSGPAGGRSV